MSASTPAGVERAAAGLRAAPPSVPSRAARVPARCPAGGLADRRSAAPRSTISERDPVTSITACASSSSVNSFGLPMLTGWCTPDSASRMMPSIRSDDVAERARLGAVAEHGDRPVLQRLAQERRDRAAVVRAHPRAVGVEDPHDRGVDALLAVVGHRQRLGVALGLVVDAARADRVHVAPVGLRLRVHLRIAVDLGRRGDAGSARGAAWPGRARDASRRSRPSACAAAAAGSRSATPARRSGRRSRPARRRRTAR